MNERPKPPSYAIVRQRVSKPTFLDDPEFRERLVSLASTEADSPAVSNSPRPEGVWCRVWRRWADRNN